MVNYYITQCMIKQQIFCVPAKIQTIIPRGYKTFFMLNSIEHEISTAHKNQKPTNKEVSCLKSLRCCIYKANTGKWLLNPLYTNGFFSLA